MPRSIRHRTIGDFIAHRTQLSFTCGGCGKTRMIDLRVLGEAIGMDWDLYWPVARKTAKPLPVKCAECGGKPTGYIVHPWTLPPDHPDSKR